MSLPMIAEVEVNWPPVAGQLHAVAGIPGETDGDGLKFFYRKFRVCKWFF
jgi:hypothetical protein